MIRLLRHVWTAMAVACLYASPAAAQLAGSIGLDSDYRLRGYSLSADQPVLSAQLTYDDRSGAYAGLSALAKVAGGARFLGVIANAGYAKRISDRVTVDGGVLRSDVRSAAPNAAAYIYTDVYAGAFVGPVSARLHYSPDYRTGGLSTLYGELEAGFAPARNWRLSAHAGLLTYLNSKAPYRRGGTHQDWRIGISRQFGRVEVHSALSGGHPYEYSGFRVHKQVAATVGASVSL